MYAVLIVHLRTGLILADERTQRKRAGEAAQTPIDVPRREAEGAI